MRTMAVLAPGETTWQPVAHVAVSDARLRSRLTEALHRSGWAVIASPTGYHLLQTLSGPLFGDQPWLRPELLVVDAFSPGCSGLTIAHGLRELGWPVPVILIAASAEHERLAQSSCDESPDSQLFVTRREVAIPTVMAVAQHHRQTTLGAAADPAGPDVCMSESISDTIEEWLSGVSPTYTRRSHAADE